MARMHRAIGVLAWAVAGLWLCAPCGFARAQQTPYRNHLVGERSLGLAGAFVGVADDASALFHNPGGIALIDTSAVAGSLWAVVRGSRDLEDGYITGIGNASLTDSGPLSLPLFLSGVVKLGSKAEDGLRPHAIGAAMFSPLQTSYRFVDQLENPTSVDRLEVRHSDSARWVGLGYGYRPHYGLSLGVSGFLASRSFTHDEVEIRARELVPADSVVGSTFTRASTLNIDTQHLVFRIGTLLQLTHELHAGVMFQVPGIEIGDSAEVEHLDTRVGPEPTQIDITSAANRPAHLSLPWELRMGLTVLRPPDSLVTLDLSLFGPDGSSTDQAQLVGGSPVPLGLFVPSTIYRRPSLRAAIGFETVAFDIVPLRGGGFFERSSAPELTPIADSYSVDRMHYAGASFSIGLRTGGYDFAIGTTAVLGFGEGLGLVRGAGPADPPRYEARNLDETMLLVFIGGARSAVRTLVKTLLED